MGAGQLQQTIYFFTNVKAKEKVLLFKGKIFDNICTWRGKLPYSQEVDPFLKEAQNPGLGGSDQERC